MDEISNAELIELISLQLSSIDVQFQVWMAATFALIVASYGSRGKLSLPVRTVIAALYLLAVLAIFLRWIADAGLMTRLQTELASRGIEANTVYWAPALRLASYWFTSFAAVAFVFYFHRKDESSGQLDCSRSLSEIGRFDTFQSWAVDQD